MDLLKKSVALEVKAADDATGTIEGYGSVFGVQDSYGDIVEKGAFAETLKSGRKVRMLYQHRADKPLGVWDEMSEDDTGLKARGRINMDSTLGRDVYGAIRMGAIEGLSIGFRIPKGGAEWDHETDIRLIKSVELWELSVVTFPANEAAMIDAIKAAHSLEEIDQLDLPGLERFLREAGLSREWAKRFMHRHSALCRQREAEEREAAELDRKLRELSRRLRS